MADIDAVTRKRSGINTSLLKVLKEVNDHATVPLDPDDVIIRIKKVEEFQRKYEALQNEVLELCADDAAAQTQADVAVIFEAKVMEVEKALRVLQRTLGGSPSGSASGSTSGGSHSSVKLPRLSLPTFSGKVEEWTSFKDLFISAVDSQTSISAAQKLQYLKVAVKGEAERLIKPFQVTDSNYKEAWDILKKRYSNEREIIQSIMKRLFAQSVMKQESASALQALADTTLECERSLAVHNVPTEHWDHVLVFIISERMDSESRRQWELTLKGTASPTFKEITEFIDQYVRGLLAIAPSRHQQRSNASGVSSHYSGADDKCGFCHQPSHSTYSCSKFQAASPEEQLRMVRNGYLCFICLLSGHTCRNCKLKKNCKTCGGRHHTLLHNALKGSATPRSQQSQGSSSKPNSSEHRAITGLHISGNNETLVLLSTALVTVVDQSGREQVCRALLDGCSQATFITDQCAQALGLNRMKAHVTVTGMSSTSVGVARSKVRLVLHSRVSPDSVEAEALILPKVTGVQPKRPCNYEAWSHIKGIQLADPGFYNPGPIDILIGADILSTHVMKDGIRRGTGLCPTALNTIFGWVLSGPVRMSEPSQEVHIHHCDISETLKRFWEIEELPSVSHYTQEEKSCEQHFGQTHTRDESGRYVVKLPFNDKQIKLGESRDIAVRRLMQVERRLESKPEFKAQYNDFMTEYLALGHMEEIKPESRLMSNCYYLPHHFVLKLDSTSTKFRVVFDGSSKTTSGVALNDTLMVGPQLQDTLFTHLIRFRCQPIALKADIGKMYRQFKVNPSECDYQRIVWRESADQPIKDYRLTTLTYGTASAPYLATKCLQQLSKDEETRFPVAAAALNKNFFVDDLLGGVKNVDEGIHMQHQLRELAKSAGMDLLKFCSSSPAVLSSIPEELREKNQTLNFDSNSEVKALGVRWNTGTDNFTFEVCSFKLPTKITMRNLSSDLAKVFDPLGWLAPVTIEAKILLQSLWKLMVDWNDELPEVILQQWVRYQSNLHFIKQIQIPRCVISCKVINMQLHGFCDASEKAYSAAVYVRCQQSDGMVTVRLVTSKTKVAPIKTVSIPRLELCGALILSKLMDSVRTAMDYKGELYGWTDSTTVLKWLEAFPSRWKTFVANRVSEIQDLIPFPNWKHVVSAENPADCASRGISAEELCSFSLWWNGPEWLSRSEFPTHPFEINNKVVESEEKHVPVLCNHVNVNSSLLGLMEKYSSLKKLERVTAYVLRFVHNCRKRLPRKYGFLQPGELTYSLSFWIKQAQVSAFPKELAELRASRPLSSKSPILSLNPYVDGDGLLRVGGRLQKAKLAEDNKHQIILPHNNTLTQLIISHYHVSHLHAGFQLLWATMQQKFWIIRARDTIRHFVRKCIVCRKRRAETAQHLMGSLPSPRVNPGQPFLHTGVDYAGPFLTRIMKGRTNKTFKSYMSIFVCFATKAVHLEAVGDLTSESFIAAFKRFASRRGVPSHMYSDNGTNFVGADKELATMLAQWNSTFANHHADQGTTWNFNPPAAPHQGGLWEAGVKSVKFHLKSVVGTHVLTFEEFQTILAQIEACLNSRPLCAMSCDPADFTALTPGHFLIGKPLTAVPEPDLTHLKINRLSRWQLTQQLTQHFWRRWSSEYLSSLQQRFKWTAKREDLKIGDLVLVKDDQQPQMKWKMGRVIDTHPGQDKIVRVVSVKTADGDYKRPVVKFCPLMSTD